MQYLAGKAPLSVLWIFFIGGCIWKAKEKRTYLVVPFMVGIFGLIYGKDEYTLVAIFALILYFCSDIKPDMPPNLFGKITSWIISYIDEYSLSIYLGHTTILNLVSYIRDEHGLSTLSVIILSGAGSIILVLLLHNVIEKPAARLSLEER